MDSYLSPPTGLSLDANTTQALTIVFKYLKEATKTRLKADKPGCKITKNALALCQHIVDAPATDTPLAAIRLLFHAEATRARRCHRSIGDFQHQLKTLPASLTNAHLALTDQIEDDGRFGIVPKRPRVIGHNLLRPESLIANGEIHRRFMLFHADLLDLLWADPILRIQGGEHEPSEAEAWAAHSKAVVDEMGASASYLAAANETVLTENTEALRVYFRRMLAEKRLRETQSDELEFWELVGRTKWFLVRVVVVGAVYAWPLAEWMARVGTLYVWPLVKWMAKAGASCVWPLAKQVARAWAWSFWPIVEALLARLIFGR